MARPPNASGERTRQAILDAALTLFADRGYFGTSIRDIAVTVGVSESAIYNYFDGKKTLFEALFLADQQSKVHRLSALANEPITDVRATLTGFAVWVVTQSIDPRQQQLFRILLSDGVRLARDGRSELLPSLSRGYAAMQNLMRRLIRSGALREAAPEQLATEFIGPILMWRLLQAVGTDFAILQDPEAFAHQHVEQFLNGASRTAVVRSGGPAPRSRRTRRTTTHFRTKNPGRRFD
jgi:AcrR family transcriptional regulator